jgi:uncharacterized protein YndB with AHSA1/START domain
MNVIDHRILVPASPDRVWQYISDISHNPQWQVDCRGVSFLTTMHTGPGTRWRTTDDKGRDRVVEVTVWYDRLGYEYKFIDGVPFSENKGQIRLQEIAEGTVVQWTFNYETSGLLGNLMNAISLRRQVEKNMVESLRTLWRVIKNSREADSHENKSLMRDAPDAESRAHYKSRHTPTFEEQLSTDIPRSAFAIPEPPLKEGDTRPGGAVQVDEPVHNEEPDFLSRASAYKTEQVPKVEAEPDAIFKPPKQDETVKIVLPGEEEPGAIPTDKMPKVEEGDSSRMSVFELFGLPKPSETQEMRPVEVPTTPLSTPTVHIGGGGRIGLRFKLRGKLVRLRRPS